jgi:hypothetical protein
VFSTSGACDYLQNSLRDGSQDTTSLQATDVFICRDVLQSRRLTTRTV